MNRDTLIRDLVNVMNARGFDAREIDTIKNDEHFVRWIEHCLATNTDGCTTIDHLFDDAGFVESLMDQIANPITFDEMG